MVRSRIMHVDGYAGSSQCKVIHRMSQDCALVVWRMCCDDIRNLSRSTHETARTIFWKWMLHIAEVSPHYAFVPSTHQQELCMMLLEGEQLFMPNNRNGSQFVQVMGLVLTPKEYLMHILRVASNMCRIAPHRLWLMCHAYA